MEGPKPPDRLWVIVRHIRTGKVHHAGWAIATGKGYVFESLPSYPEGHRPSEYKFERQPAHRIGAFW